MTELRAVIRKELIHTRRDARLMGYVVALPVILVLLFGSALRLKIDNLRVAVWDQDRTFFSLEVKDHLQREGGLNVVEVASERFIRDMLRSGDVELGLIIPAGFSKRLADSEQTTFDLLVDGTMPTVAQAALYGARVLESEDVAEKLTLDDPEHPSAPVRRLPIKMRNIVLFNPGLRDSDFFLPGALGIVIMLVCLTLSTTGFVREKEQDTIEQLCATPISRVSVIAGKIIPHGMIAVADFVVVTSVARAVFALPLRGSILSIALLAVLFILAILALGSFISTLSETQLQATFMNVFVFTLSLLLSGFIFPRQAMPGWLQPIASALPMTYFIDGIRALALKGTVATEILHDFVALAAFLLLFGSLSVARFRKTMG